MNFISTTKLFLAITLIGFSFTSLSIVKSPAFYNFEYIAATSDSNNSTQMTTLDASQNSEADKAVMAVPPNESEKSAAD